MRCRLLLGLAAAAAGSALLLGCTSSGDGGEGSVDDFRNRGAHVTPDARSSAEWVDIVETSGDGDSTCVSVAAHNAFDAFNAAFTVSYDPTVLSFAGWSDAGNCLAAAGSGVMLPTLVDAATTPGSVVVGLSRNGAVITTGATCGHFVELCFDVIGEGDSRLAFTGNRQIQDPSGTPITVEWVGSDVVTRL